MKFEDVNRIGVAGTYLLAYAMTQLFRCPCRILDVDVGVDAELEFVNDDSEASGDIIKIQIKTVNEITAKDTHSIYVDEKHIKYWQMFSAPIIVCCVDLKTENIYWKHIANTEAYKTAGMSRKIVFDLKNDLLREDSINELRALIPTEKRKEIAVLKERIISELEPLTKIDGYCDFEAIGHVEEQLSSIKRDVKNLEEAHLHYPWILGNMGNVLLKNFYSQMQRIDLELSVSSNALIEGG